MDFSRQEYWSGSPVPIPGDLPNQESDLSPAMEGGYFTTEPPEKFYNNPEITQFLSSGSISALMTYPNLDNFYFI